MAYKVGETISAEEFNQTYSVGQTISADEFNQSYGQQTQQPQAPVQPQTPQRQSLSSVPLNVISNIPSSAFNFAKNTILNPINTAKTVSEIPKEFSAAIKELGGISPVLSGFAKELPSAALKVLSGLIPESTRQAFSGDFEGASKKIQEDPVGQILPYLLVARGVAEKAGKGAQFDQTISKIASPVTKSASAVGGYLGNKAGQVSSQILGAETGAGASSIRTAVNPSEQFRAAMRGKISPEETVTQLQDAFRTIKDNRSAEYLGKLKSIKNNESNLDISPIQKELGRQLDNFNIGMDAKGNLDFSNSAIRFDKGAQSDIQNIFQTMQKFGENAKDTTPIGLDSLKRAFGDLYSNSSGVRAFTQSMKDSVRTTLNKNVPEYETMTKGYNTASNLLNDIKSATSLGGKANADTVFTKVTNALKSDKEFRLQMLNELENGAGVKLTDALAGHNLSKWIPSGITGRAIDVSTAVGILYNVFNPAMIPALMSTSPRIVGEFLNGLGVAKQYVAPIVSAINKLPEISQNINVKDLKSKAGLSIEDVSKVHPEDQSFMKNFIDYSRLKKPENVKLEIRARELAQNLGINSDIPNTKLASKFDELLSKIRQTPNVLDLRKSVKPENKIKQQPK